MTAYEYLCFKSDLKDWKDAVKSGDMEKEEMLDNIKEIMEDKENRKKKKSKIVKEVDKKEREKRKQEQIKRLGGTDKILTWEQIKWESIYYYLASGTCTPCVNRRDKTSKTILKKKKGAEFTDI